MIKSEVKNENSTRNNILYRASLRGLKRCTSCGYINGQRALICRNISCSLRTKMLAAIKPFDPIQLVTYGPRKLYSLRSKEKLLQPRNFLSITESRGTIDTHSCVVCYVDNCKYDHFEPAHLVCRHIKACKMLTNVTLAEVYPIDKSILWNLNIPLEQKQHLWDLYQLEEKLVHPVQKLNSSVFVVKCVQSKTFPAGRLHVTVFSNKFPNKSGTFSCSCKKLKIILEPDNSVIMKQEICDHLLLILSAILNKPEGKTLYGKFLDLLQHLWMPTYLNTPIADCGSRSSQFLNYGLSVEKNIEASTKAGNVEEASDNSNDIFNFSEELFAENNIPDFSDIILNANSEEVSNLKKLSIPKQTAKTETHIKDPKLNTAATCIKDEEMDLNFPNFNSPDSYGTHSQSPIDFNGSGLSVVEQFQLNHNMKISNENIELAKDIECLNNLEFQVIETNRALSPSLTIQKSLLKTYSGKSSITEDNISNSCILINPIKNVTTLPAQKSIVLTQGPVRVTKIGTPIKQFPAERNGKVVQISKIDPNQIILLKNHQYADSVKQIPNKCNVIQAQAPRENIMDIKQINSVAIPSISYESWLDNVIEILNESISIQETTVKNTFHVPEYIFNHFSKTFTLNNKRINSYKTTIVKNEKYKGHIKYTWYFNKASTVQRIFTTKNMKIELERSFQRLPDNSYKLYTPTIVKLTDNNNFRTIYPKVELYKAFIQFTMKPELCSNNSQPQKCGLKMEWLPSAYPKSNFGLMTIEFSVSSIVCDGRM